ncbi:Bax inhibitor-1/YccA family protein [Cryomorphaceae bacterium 1068]|nr:Bax inhibitor-1/YccA family protein [Cryomorphaceae bacterium 1068]
MEENNNMMFGRDGGQHSAQVDSGALAKNFVSNVMTYMTAALAITGVMAYWFGTNEDLMRLLYNAEGTGRSLLGWIAMLGPLGLVLLMGFRFQKMSSTGMLTTMIIFSLLMGISLSSIFAVYSASSITMTFLITSATFGIMAVLGYTTSTDLTKFGSIMMMGLIGIIIAMVVNWFMQSAALDYIISAVGVLIFTGLTAYDMQKLKQIGMQVDSGTDEGNKYALMGALTLYLDFINLFLFLLRFLGNRD